MPFLHQSIRDLHWLLAGPPLMSDLAGFDQPPPDWLSAQVATAEPWLAELDDNPTELQRFLGAEHLMRMGSFRLGHHAERMLEFFLARRPGGGLMAARRELMDGARTVGELDVVFRDPVRGVVHWEVSTKFFLRSEPSARWTAYIGVTSPDDLQGKLRKVVDHQLPLGRSQLAADALAVPLGSVTSEALLRGWLFYPATEDWARPSVVPAAAAPGHGRGWWLRHGETEVPAAARSSRFHILRRPEWLSPVHLPDDGATVPIAANDLAGRLVRHFRQNHAPVLVAELRRDGDGWWRELARGFVVHARWPVPAEAPKR
ncbi:MAG: DUF1853 family protein [Planctomycetes bacterium]|nr:DUF1853 family protein [Planctomycetota bacterium]